MNNKSINPTDTTESFSGLFSLDRFTNGFRKRDLIVVASRPGVGKTCFALNIASYAAKLSGRDIVYFSLEMSGQQLVSRLLSKESKIIENRLKVGKLHKNEWDRFKRAAISISDSSLVIIDDATMSITDMYNKCKLFNNLGLVIIDYVQLISSGSNDPTGKYENRVQNFTEISRMMKVMAVELNIPVICLSQLNRDIDYRTNQKPALNDLREFGSLSQDADVIFGLYRDDYYDVESGNPDTVEVIILKNRHGSGGTVPLGWLPERATFYELPGQPAWG